MWAYTIPPCNVQYTVTIYTLQVVYVAYAYRYILLVDANNRNYFEIQYNIYSGYMYSPLDVGTSSRLLPHSVLTVLDTVERPARRPEGSRCLGSPPRTWALVLLGS